MASINKNPLKKEGKGCSKSEGGSGCIVKRRGGWVILNNKKGGVWKKCKSKEHCESILDAYHANKSPLQKIDPKAKLSEKKQPIEKGSESTIESIKTAHRIKEKPKIQK